MNLFNSMRGSGKTLLVYRYTAKTSNGLIKKRTEANGKMAFASSTFHRIGPIKTAVGGDEIKISLILGLFGN